MSDKPNIEIVRNAPQQTQNTRSLKRRWLLFFGVFLLLILLLLVFLLTNSTALDGVKRFFRYFGKDDAQYGRLRLSNYGTCSYAIVDNRFAVGTQNGASVYAEDGTVIGSVQGNFTAPTLKSNAEHLLIYDIGGTEFAMLNAEGDVLFSLEADGPIFDAELSAEGYVSVLCDGSDSRAVLTVYSASGSPIYRRNSKTKYLNTCAITSDGSLAAVSTLGQTDIDFQSSIQYLETDQENPTAEFSVGDRVIYDLTFFENEHLCAISADALLFLDETGELLAEVPAESGTLTLYSSAGESIAVLYRSEENNSLYHLAALDTRGAVIATADFTGTPLSLTSCDSYIAVLTQQELFIFDGNLTLRNKTQNTGYLYALARPDGTAMCVSSGAAELFIP